MFIIIYGDLIYGFRFFGPFDNKEKAIKYGELYFESGTPHFPFVWNIGVLEIAPL